MPGIERGGKILQEILRRNPAETSCHVDLEGEVSAGFAAVFGCSIFCGHWWSFCSQLREILPEILHEKGKKTLEIMGLKYQLSIIYTSVQFSHFFGSPSRAPNLFGETGLCPVQDQERSNIKQAPCRVVLRQEIMVKTVRIPVPVHAIAIHYSQQTPITDMRVP